MIENPYEAPGSALENNAKSIRLYSPVQVACGTIGGPVGLIYFLRDNFIALENNSAATKTLLWGVVLIVALIAIVPFLPDNIPSAPFTIAYIIAAKSIAEKYQLTKQAISESHVYAFHSNWRVLGMGLLCLLGSVLTLIVPLMLLVFLGVIE